MEMDLPSQVKDAETRSNALLDQIRAQQAAPPEVPAAEPAATPAESTPAAHADEGLEYWRQRFSVLSGKYNAEVPRMAASLREKDAKIATLESRVAELEAQLAGKGRTQQTTEADLSAFDPELIDMTRRIAREAVQEAVKPAAAAPTQETKLADDQAAREQFLDSLSDLVDDWEAVDKDQAWKMYLSQVEPDTGKPRQARLSAAVARFDVVTTASIFQSFKRARAASRPAPNLAGQVVPETAGRGTGAGEPAPTFTRNQVRKFYSDVNSGKIRDQAEIQRVENQINAALREGRIVAG